MSRNRMVLGLAVLLGASFASSLARADDQPAPSESVSSNVPTTPPETTVKTVESANEPPMETDITRKTIPNRPLLTTGSVLLVGSYVPAVIGAAVSGRQGDDKLYIPVAGPWMAMNEGHSETGGQKALLAIDGVFQGLGALSMLSSLFIPERTTRHWHLLGQGERLQVGPQHLRAGFGLGARGTF